MDLLSLTDLAPPMGDTAFAPNLAAPRALWTAPIEGEAGAPEHRIIHANVLQLHGDAELRRIGLRRTPGYHKCGSVHDLDWVRAFRILVFDGRGWDVVLHETACRMPDPDETIWFDLSGLRAATLLIEARESGIDQWWTSWNLAAGAFVVDGTPSGPPSPRSESSLSMAGIELHELPDGVSAARAGGEIRFRTSAFEVGFWLNRAAMAYFAIGDSRQPRAGRDAPIPSSSASSGGPGTSDLLRSAPGFCFQGPQLHVVGAAPAIAPALRNAVEGTTEVRGNRVIYDLQSGDQTYRLAWEVLADRLVLHAERESAREQAVWNGSIWQLGFDVTAAVPHVLGPIIRKGQSGLMRTPAWLHVPGAGSVRITSDSEDVRLRSEALRALDLTTLEIKLGERPGPHGEYVLPAGRFEAQVDMRVDEPDIPLRADTPDVVARAVRRCYLTALTYRADTATFSNNGVSIHCPISMDNWSALATRMGPILPSLDPIDLFRDSLERWLDGGPGYTSGRILQSGEMHEAEEEYVMTYAACLLGLSDFLRHSGSAEWLDRYEEPIRSRIARARALDLDGDGLAESRYRTGISGTGQWSTCWFDVISFGWKDAFANALLYAALDGLSDAFRRFNRSDLADELESWARTLRASYYPTFYNPETGRLAGWRCKEERLHDYAFPFVNGAAVCSGVIDEEDARPIVARLWDEMQRVGRFDAYYGLPGNLHHIPDEDLADIMQGYPLGFYQNGGLTHAQSRHFVGALYRVGMTDEADRLLQRLCAGMADGTVYGGCRSGLDWHYWDGRPCGYEGILTDQFGILAVALERYGIEPQDGSAQG